MTKQDANSLILSLILGGTNTSKAIIATGQLEATVVDNTLRRLKAEGSATFDKVAKVWTLTEEGKLKASAPAADSVEGSAGEGAEGTAKNTEGNDSTMSTENTNSVDDIDAKIAQARAAKDGGAAAPTDGKRAKLTAEERAARDKAKEEERAKRKQERDTKRAEKKAAREASKKPAHMSKVDKAAGRLPKLDESAQLAYNEVTANLSRDQVTALSLHLQHFNRVQATEVALSQKLTEGQPVLITGGDARFVGKTGTVFKAQRIRCYVTVPGVDKPVYLYTSDVKPTATIEAAEQQAAEG